MSDRALAPVVGVVLLVAVTAVLAVGVVAGVVESPGPAAAPTAAFDGEADATGEIRAVHAGGDTIAPDELGLRVRVDGEPLAAQPPVPFFSATGFESGPTGMFNRATRGERRAGQAASLRVADSNEPTLSAGATVELRLYVDGVRVAALEVPVQAASMASPSPSIPSFPPVASSDPFTASLSPADWSSSAGGPPSPTSSPGT